MLVTLNAFFVFRFTGVTPDQLYRACSQHTMNMELKLGNLAEELKDGDIPINYDFVVDKVQSITYPVDTAFNWARLQYFLKGIVWWRYFF